MIDFTKPVKPEQIEKNVADAVNKSKEMAIKVVDYNEAVFKESIKLFNDMTDKFFYTYTVKAAEAVNQSTVYAKEFIQTGTVKSLFGNSVKN